MIDENYNIAFRVFTINNFSRAGLKSFSIFAC